MSLFRANADANDIAAWAEQAFEKMHTARLTIERKWLLNLAFYQGNQWVVWSPPANNTRRLEDPRNEVPWRVRLTVNKVKPYIRREMARLSSQKPRGFVLPASQEESDRHAARAAISVLDFLHEELDLDECHDLADWWTCICGPAFYKVRFTNDIDSVTKKPGKLAVDVLRPFDLYVADLEESKIKAQEYICQAQAIRIAEIYDRFGVDVAPDGYTSEVDARVRTQMGIFGTDKGEDWAIVKEFWIKPCTRYPDGLVLATANGKLLPFSSEDQVLKGPQTVELEVEGEPSEVQLPAEEFQTPVPEGTIRWPYAHGRLPFVPRGHTKSGRFYDTTFVDDLISLQREYNRSRSQIVENKNLTSRPQWAVALGSVNRADLTTEPGAYIPYAPGFAPPEPIKPPQLPNYVVEHVKLTAQEMDDIASQNEVSKGDVPPNVEAATAIAYLQEKDESAVNYAVRNKERAIQEIGKQLLGLVKEFWDEPRTIRIVGRNEIYDAIEFMGGDLGENTDFRVVPGSGLPRSRAAQEAKIMQMAENGLLPGAKALRLLDMPDIAAVIADVEVDIIEADKENLIMSKGQYAPAEVWQDHVAHLDEHDNFKKREEYKHLPEEIWQIFRYHDFNHLMQLAQLFNMMPPDMQIPQPSEQDPYPVDPAMEFILRQIFIQLKAGGGAPPPTSPATVAPGGEPEPASV